jgi:hypothetical protein
MLKVYLKFNNYNRAFSDLFPLSFSEEKGDLGVLLPPNNVYIFEAPGLHFWRFLKQIRKRIGSKMTVFYKNDYHITKITTFLRKFYLKMSKFKLEFYQPQLPPRHTPRPLRPCVK